MKKYSVNADLKSIAAEIAQQIHNDSYRQYYDSSYDTIIGRQVNGAPIIGGGNRAEFTIGTLKLRCEDTPQALTALHAKYARYGSGYKPAWLCSGKLPKRNKEGAGIDYGALVVVEHETLPA